MIYVSETKGILLKKSNLFLLLTQLIICAFLASSLLSAGFISPVNEGLISYTAGFCIVYISCVATLGGLTTLVCSFLLGRHIQSNKLLIVCGMVALVLFSVPISSFALMHRYTCSAKQSLVSALIQEDRSFLFNIAKFSSKAAIEQLKTWGHQDIQMENSLLQRYWQQCL